MSVRGMKKGLKRASKLARKSRGKATLLLRAAAPIAIAVATEALPGARAVRLASEMVRRSNG